MYIWLQGNGFQMFKRLKYAITFVWTFENKPESGT